MSSREYNTECRKRNRERIRERDRENAAAIAVRRSEKRLSDKLTCALCPESRLGALHIDHPQGGGRTHRRGLKCDGSGFYRWLRLSGFPAGYRVLCANCNIRSYVEGRVLADNSWALRTLAYNAALKKSVMERLGGECVNCGCTDIRVLTVHHTACNGAEHRRAVSGGKASYRFYRAVLRSGDFAGLECLCYSCNDAHGILACSVL